MSNTEDPDLISQIPPAMRDWLVNNGYAHQKIVGGDKSWCLGWTDPIIGRSGTSYIINESGRVDRDPSTDTYANATRFLIFNLCRFVDVPGGRTWSSFGFVATDERTRVEFKLSSFDAHQFDFDDKLPGRLEEFEQAAKLVLDLVEEGAGSKPVYAKLELGSGSRLSFGDLYSRRDYEMILAQGVMEAMFIERGYKPSLDDRSHLILFVKELPMEDKPSTPD